MATNAIARDYTASFSLGAGASTTLEVQLDNIGDYLIDQLNADAWCGSTAGSLPSLMATQQNPGRIAFGKGSATSVIVDGSNAGISAAIGAVIPTMASIEVKMSNVNNNWQNEPTPLSTIAGTGTDPGFLTNKYRGKSGSKIKIEIYNRATIACAGAIVFRGTHEPIVAK